MERILAAGTSRLTSQHFDRRTSTAVWAFLENWPCILMISAAVSARSFTEDSFPPDPARRGGEEEGEEEERETGRGWDGTGGVCGQSALFIKPMFDSGLESVSGGVAGEIPPMRNGVGERKLTLADGGRVERVLLLEPVGHDQGVGVGLGLLHAIAAGCVTRQAPPMMTMMMHDRDGANSKVHRLRRREEEDRGGGG